MIRYLDKVKALTSSFKAFSIKQVPRNKNKKADALILAVVEEEGDTWMTPIFKYLSDGTLPEEGKKARAVKRKSWRMHAGTRSVMAKALRIGYYWLTMHEDARKLIQACQDCQVHKPCEKLCIRQHFASVKHSQIHGLVERANRSLGEGIKARLDERSKNWMEELPHVLWAHRTTIKSSNGDTPFSLTYETEAVISAEIGMPTLRTAKVNLEKNKEALEINLDLLEERREHAAIQEAKSKAKMERYYNSKVRSVSFKLGDLVYHNNEASRAKDTVKLDPK
ncbi:reverse transcriptase domain-containing protein [Tanacetum coccineum]